MSDSHLLKKPSKPSFTMKLPEKYLEDWHREEYYLPSEFNYKEFIEVVQKLLEGANKKAHAEYTVEHVLDDSNKNISIYYVSYDRTLYIEAMVGSKPNPYYEKDVKNYNKKKQAYEAKYQAYLYELNIYYRLIGKIENFKKEVEGTVNNE